MKIRDIMDAASMGDRKQLRPMILWTILEYMFRGAPYGVLLLVVWELFYPLQHSGAEIDLGAIGLYSVLFALSLMLLYFISKVNYKKVYYKSYDLCADGRLSIADHLRKLSMGFFNSKDPGDIGSYLITDYANVEFILSHLLPQIIGAIVMPTFLLIVLATQSWQLALVSALVIPVAIPFTFISKAVITHFGNKHLKARIDASSRMLEYIQGMRLIKAFNLTGAKFDRLEKTFRRLKNLSIKLEAGPGPTILLSSFVLNAGLTLIILFGLTFLFAGTVSLPVYVMFLILGTRVYEPLIQVMMYMAELNYYQRGIERLNDLRATAPLTGSKPGLEPSSFDTEFDDISFRYHETDVLKHVSFKVPERSLVALVGPSGSGKTTMTRLIARFWDVNGGAIRMGGEDIRSFDPDILLSSVSIAVTSLSTGFPRDMRPWSAKGAAPSPEAKSSASPLPVPFSRMHRSSSLTRQRQASTRRMSSIFRKRSTDLFRAKPWLLLPTVLIPLCMQMPLRCWMRDALWSRGHIRS
jgi:ATP-binding cassette subfamily B protein